MSRPVWKQMKLEVMSDLHEKLSSGEIDQVGYDRNVIHISAQINAGEADQDKLIASADAGDKIALYKYGKCYEHGDGVEKSATKAFECFEKSAV